MKLKDLDKHDTAIVLLNDSSYTEEVWRFKIVERYYYTQQTIRYNGFDWRFKSLNDNWITISDNNIEAIYTRELNPEHFL